MHTHNIGIKHTPGGSTGLLQGELHSVHDNSYLGPNSFSELVQISYVPNTPELK